MPHDIHIKGNHPKPVKEEHCADSKDEFCSTADPAGTDPNRYKYISSDKNEAVDDNTKDEDRNAKNNNHTTPQERMISPDKGEQ